MSEAAKGAAEEVEIDAEKKEEEHLVEQPINNPAFLAMFRIAYFQQQMANAASNQNALPDFVSAVAAQSALMNHLQYNPNSIELIRQFQQHNEDGQAELVPPNDNSTSPELMEGQVAQFEQKSKRSRQKRKEFPIETGETGHRKRRNVDSVLATMMRKAADTEMARPMSSVDASITAIKTFDKETSHKYETVNNTLRSLAEEIKRSNFAPLMGQAEKVNSLADEVDRQFQMWKDIIPHAEHSVHRHRMSSDDQGVLNTLLSHYKTEHPEQFNQVLKTVAQLYDKQERIVMNNFRRAQAKDREMANDRQGAATRTSFCASDESDGNRTSEASGQKDDSVTVSDFSSLLANLDASSTTTESPSASETNSSTEPADQLNNSPEIQSLIAAAKKGDSDADNTKLVEAVVQMVTSHATLVQLVSKLF